LRYSTPFSSRNAWSTGTGTAKLTFCGNVPVALTSFQLRRGDADQSPSAVDHRSAAVAGLDRRRDLKQTAIAFGTAEAADHPRGDPQSRAEQAPKGIAARRNRLAQLGPAVAQG
jgi:hypothetical protein